MPTIAELGQRVKAKYPGAYDDVPDADLGTRIKAKYPGQYDDFADEVGPTPFVDQILRGSAASQIPQPRRQRAILPSLVANTNLPQTARLGSSQWEKANLSAQEQAAKEAIAKQAGVVPDFPIQIPGQKEILNQAAGSEMQAKANENRFDAQVPQGAIDFAGAVPGALASPFKYDPMDTRNPVNRVKRAIYNSAEDPEALVRELETVPESQRQQVLMTAVDAAKSDFQGGLANYVEPPVEGEPGPTTAAKAFARTIYGMTSPQSLGEMALLGGAGKAARAAVNSPAVVEALANSPRLRQAVDVAGAAAVPGGMSIKTGIDAVQAGKAAADATSDTERTNKMSEAVTNALMSMGLLVGAVKAGEGVKGEYVEPGATPRRRRLSRDAQTAIETAYGSDFKPPAEVDPLSAISRATELRKRGSNLAADDVLEKANPGGYELRIGKETYAVQETPVQEGRVGAQITNSAGEVVFGGTREGAAQWIAQRLDPTFKAGAGPAVVEATRGAEINKPVEGSLAQSLLRERAPVVESAPVAPKGKTLFEPSDIPGGAVLGRSLEAGVAKGYRVPVQYGVIEADNAVTSHDDNLNPNAAFPQDRQPRQRDRVASQMQIQDIISNLFPAQLGGNAMASDGAPVLDPEGNFVESGNGRTIALRKAYNSYPEIAQRYRDWLTEEAPYLGIDPQQISGLKKPMLVRFRGALPAGIDARQFGVDANEDSKAQMNATERALADAQQMDDDILSKFVPGETGAVDTAENVPFATSFFSKIVAPGELGNLIGENGELSKEGSKRLKYALFAKAYRDPSAIQRLSEDTNSTVANLINGMFYASPKMAAVSSGIEAGQLHPLGIGTDISKAVHRIENLRYNGVPVSEYLKQIGLHDEDLVHGLLMEMFDTYKRSPRRIGEVLNEYANGVVDQGNPKQPDFFSTGEPATKSEILEAAIKAVAARVENEKAERAKKAEQAGSGQAANGADAVGIPAANPTGVEPTTAVESGSTAVEPAPYQQVVNPTPAPETPVASKRRARGAKAAPFDRVLEYLKSNPSLTTGQSLRDAMPDLSPDEISQAVSKLRSEDRIFTHQHSDPHGAAQKDGSIFDPARKDSQHGTPIYYAAVQYNPEPQAPAAPETPAAKPKRQRGLLKKLQAAGSMSFREMAEATGSTLADVHREVAQLHDEGKIELLESGPDAKWAEPETELLQNPADGKRYYGARAILVKTSRRGQKPKEAGAVKIDFLTGWSGEDPDETPKFEFANKSTEERFRAAGKQTPPRESHFDNVQQIIRAFTRVYRHLPQGKYPVLTFELKQLEKASSIASAKAQEAIRRITIGLKPNQFDAFRKKVVIDDLYETMMQFVEDMKLKFPLQWVDLGNDTVRVPLNAVVKSAGKDKADPAKVKQMVLDWEQGQAPSVSDGIYNEQDGRIIVHDAAMVDAAREANLSHVDVKLSNHQAMVDDQKEVDRDITFAFGMTFPEIISNREDVSKFTAKDPAIQKAIEKRKEVWKNVRNDFIAAMRSAGVEIEERLQREDYYRHRVLQNIAAKQAAAGQGGIYTPRGRSYLKGRGVNPLDYSTNYVESEYEVLTQLIADTAKANMVGFLKNPTNGLNIIGKLKEDARQINIAAAMEEFAKQGMSAEDVFTRVNWRRSTLVETLAEMAAADQLPAAPEFEPLKQELADAYKQSLETDRPLKVTSPVEDFVRYVGWLRDQANQQPAGLTVPLTPTEITIRRVVRSLANPSRIPERVLKEVLQHNMVGWQHLVPDTHTEWAPDRGNTYFMVNSIPEQIAKDIFEAAGGEVGVTSDDLRRVLAVGARREPLVVPVEVARTLDDLRTNAQKHPIAQFLRKIQGKWKQFQLISPAHWFMYNLRNMSGDLEIALVGNPKSIRKLPQAAKELWNWFRKREMTPSLEAWMERGGFQSGLTIQELEDLGNDKHFRKLMSVDGPIQTKRTWNPLTMWYEGVSRPTSEFREGLLRYANFLEYRDQMGKSGRPDNFGASRRSDVMALKTVDDRAYKLSNDLMGAYDEVTEGGKIVRDMVIPFWSFQELNFRRYMWLVRNAGRDQKSAAMVGRALLGKAVLGAPMLAIRMGAALFKMFFGFWALTMAWNYLYGDKEDTLPSSIRQVPHMVLGSTEEGTTLYWNRLGNVPDLAEWLDVGETSPFFHDWLDGRINGTQLIGKLAMHQVTTPVEKIVTTSVPGIMIPAQYLMGRRFYPDITNPRTIRDRNAFIADQFQMRWAYDLLAGKPIGPEGTATKKLLRSTFMKESDPLESAYYDTLDNRREYYRKKGKEEYVPGGSSDPRKEAAYNLKVAVRKRDFKAFERYLEEYYANGGTAQSLKRATETFDPLYRMKPTEKREFVDSLQGEDRMRLILAQQYYRETFKSGRLQEFLQRANIRPQPQAK